MKPSVAQPVKKRTKKIALWASIILFVAALLALTHDIILTNILAYKICKSDPQPKTFTKKTVEYPDSIYWEDNIYPGFNEKDRLLMIRNYLDGVHLKTMALNAPDGSIYLFTATEKDWQNSRDIKAYKREGNYFNMLSVEAKVIAERGINFTRQTMPQLNYSVTFNPVSLTPFQRRYLWSDEVKIVDNKTDEVLAYNRRLMRRWYLLMPDIGIGRQYYYPHAMCGMSSYAGFDQRVFVFYKTVSHHPAHMGITRDLFKKLN
ncbi:MAG: hypothetical protein KJ804_13030 [Proteobacteria bacterium]|nr:hypothetical protein [Pseudomonadota bacterium]